MMARIAQEIKQRNTQDMMEDMRYEKILFQTGTRIKI